MAKGASGEEGKEPSFEAAPGLRGQGADEKRGDADLDGAMLEVRLIQMPDGTWFGSCSAPRALAAV